VFGERRIDESVIGIEAVEHRTVLPDKVHNEPDRFLEHRLSKFVIEGRETLAINGVVFLKSANSSQCPPNSLAKF